jgi:hypothetical protein
VRILSSHAIRGLDAIDRFGKNGFMPKPRDPNRKKPPRVAIHPKLAPIVDAYAEREAKDLSEVVNDALRYYFANAFPTPLWPPPVPDKGHDA